MSAPPAAPKIYHIAHVDRLISMVAAGELWCDATIIQKAPLGTTIGMSSIKQRRLTLPLTSHPSLKVGQCVPFYFCPRSIMLYLLHRGNHVEITYKGGQGPIVHLECDLFEAIKWAELVGRRWAFTLSNAGARYFEDRANISALDEINWDAVSTNQWSGYGVSSSVKEGKQAEFLVEQCFPWHLVRRIGVLSPATVQAVSQSIPNGAHRPTIEIKRDWYY